jgi:hypothetical protein
MDAGGGGLPAPDVERRTAPIAQRQRSRLCVEKQRFLSWQGARLEGLAPAEGANSAMLQGRLVASRWSAVIISSAICSPSVPTNRRNLPIGQEAKT